MSVLLKDLPKNDLPRERLLYYGVENLSDEELITLILRTGTRDMSAKNLSALILKELKGINGLKEVKVGQLSKIKGMGIAKSTNLIAALELGRRVYHLERPVGKLLIKNAEIAIKYFGTIINEDKQENFLTIYLDNQQQYISHRILFKGSNNKSVVDPKEVFKEAILMNSNNIIIMHNHPSGVVRPSSSDDELTSNFVNIGTLMNIQVLDHIIVGKEKYYSYIEEGKLMYE